LSHGPGHGQQPSIDDSSQLVANSQCSERPPSNPSQEQEEDSFEYVEFDKSRASLDSSASLRAGLPSQSSLHDSMQDSLLFLPPAVNREARVVLSENDPAPDSQEDSTTRTRTTQPTILSLVQTERHAELVDYYDIDRYCELVPCWAYANQSTCALHPDPIRRPMLLFCLQALDEFIGAATSILRTDSALVASCRLARIVFASMWEQDVRNMGFGSDIVIADYVSAKVSLPGVSQDVWKIIDSCWQRHKQHFLHHQELFFDDAGQAQPCVRIEQWHRVRHLLQVFALRPETARRLEAERPVDRISLPDLQPGNFTRGESSRQSIELGVDYLRLVREKHHADKSPLHRDLLNQSDWKVAFSAIEIHLKQWSREAQVFPCGAFSRGAAYGSVVDVLVGLPEQQQPNDGESPVVRVLQVLAKAKIVDKESVRQLSNHRVLAIIPFKKSSVILDVKVYERPRSWFALLYFTGPECFSQTYFSRLLNRPLRELEVVDFDHVYACTVEHLGLEVVASVDSEKHLFDLISAKYLQPSQRM
jgi:hypothetical protein